MKRKPSLRSSGNSSSSTAAWARWTGIGLLILSFAFYGGLLLLPFVAMDGVTKAAAVPVLIALGEVAFWIGGLLLGKEVVARYRRFFNPRDWRRQK
jgi:hypothetical protein